MATIIRRRKLGMSSAKGISELSKTGIRWCRNDLGIPNDNVYIRWGCTANVPVDNAIIINTAKAIHKVNDKLGFRRDLEEASLCPKTWFNINDVDPDTLRDKGVVVRPRAHAQGRKLWFVDDREQLRRVCNNLGEYYINEFIDKKEEFRVFVAQGRVACVAKKTPANPEEIAWNVAKGGRFDNVRWDEWNLKAVKKSIEAFNLSGLDFGGVDVMVDADNNAYILEINSAPSLTSPYRQSCMSKVLDYIVDNGKGNIPLVDERGGYTKFVHPAITDKARMVGGL